MTETPPPWRPRGLPEGEGDDDPTMVVPLPVDRTVVGPAPVPPYPPYPPGAVGPQAPYGGYPPYPGWSPYGQQPPPSPSRRWIPIVAAAGGLLAGIIVVGALLYSAGLPTGTSAQTTIVTAPPTTRPTTSTTDKGPGVSADEPAPRGTAVTPAKGWRVAVVDVDRDANAEMARAAWWMRPEAGKQFVVVTLDLTHAAESTSAFFAEVKLSLQTKKGSTIRPELINPLRDHLSAGVQLPPQGTTSGTVAFKVAKGEVGGAVLVAEPMFTLDQDEDRRYLSLDG